MSKCYKCYAEIETPTSLCLNCNTKNAIAAGIFNEESKIETVFFGVLENEYFSIKKYEETPLNVYFDLIAEKLHDRRVDDVYIGGCDEELIEQTHYYLKNSIYPFNVYLTNIFNKNEFFNVVDRHVRVKNSLKKVKVKAEKKIHGSHSTIIGGREGRRLVYNLASSEYVKKIIPGVIENKGTVSGGVRLKVTRSDENGNIKALLINGATVQRLYVITTASNKEEGEEILKILKTLIN